MFVDSSFWVALADRKDPWHDRAVALRSEIRGNPVVPDLAASESLTVVGSRLGGKAARELYGHFLDSCTLRFLDKELLDEAMQLHLAHDGRLSVPDCATVEGMIRAGERVIVSFDRDLDAVRALRRIH